MKVRALVKTYYNRRDVFPGEEYEMDDRDQTQANVLAAIGHIQIIEPSSIPGQIEPTESVAAPPREEAPSEASPGRPQKVMTTESADAIMPSRPRYRRRDMKAQEE